MILARRIATKDDRGDLIEDYEAVDVPRAAKRAQPIDDSTEFHRRQMIKLRAIQTLRDHGFTAAEVAVAVEFSKRHVKRRSAYIREVALARGRV